MFTRSKSIAPRAIVLLAATLSTAGPVSAQISTVVDPVGDTFYRFTPAFQDIVFGQVTKTASGDFELLMEVAGPVGVNPPLPPPAHSGIWWVWAFDLDPTTSPRGYPLAPGVELWAECIVSVTWDGTNFAGTAIDRRPLLTGGEAIITPVVFTINGRILEAVVPSAVIGAVPPSFVWGAGTAIRSGPVDSQGYGFVDETAATVFNP